MYLKKSAFTGIMVKYSMGIQTLFETIEYVSLKKKKYIGGQMKSRYNPGLAKYL